MAEYKFKAGDVVYLNSHPNVRMTVIDPCNAKHLVEVAFYSLSKDDFIQKAFTQEALTKVINAE